MAEAWPFPARAPIGEVLEWRTDVLVSEAAEQRIALRPVPREIVTYRHLLDATGMARAAELARAGFLSEWLVPLWAMAARMAVDLLATDTAIPIDTALGDWRGPGHAVVTADGGEAHPVEVAAVLPDRLELAAPVGVGIASPIVAPARRGIMSEPVGIERRRQGLGIVSATFTMADGIDLGASPYPAQAGLDVLTEPAVLRQPLKDAIGQTVEYVDNGFGPIVAEPVLDHIQRRSTITLVDHGPAARWTRRRWLYALRGRQAAFWLPSWGRELVLQAPVGPGDTSIAVAPLGDPAALVGRHIMIESGSGLFREITAAAWDALGVRLTIAAPGVAVPQETSVHLMTKVRLDTDRVELAHDATRTEFSAAVVEVPA